MSDRNLVSFWGRPDGYLELVDLRQPPGHTNTVLRQAGDLTPITHDVGDVIPEPDWSDALKLSGAVNLTVNAGTAKGGTEDVFDANHCRNCSVFIQDAYPRGKYVSTQKGESDGITLTIYRQHGHGTEVDHDYGNRSDQGNGNTTNSRLSVKQADGPVLVRVLRATKPQLDGGPFKWAFPSPTAWYHGIVIWFLNLTGQ